MSDIDTTTIFMLIILVPTLAMVVIFGYEIVESSSARDTFCVSNGFETYQTGKCVKITEDGKIISKKFICIENAPIKFLPTKCGWDE